MPPGGVDIARRLIIRSDGATISPTPQQWVVLMALLRQPGALVTTDALIAAMYGGARDGGPDNPRAVLKMMIWHLRKIVPWPIVNFWGVGYRIETP